jgi:hypothetical protein
MFNFGLSCDEETYRLIQSIPPGHRSKTIRKMILDHAHEIEEMKDEYWALQLEQKMGEKRREQERLLEIEFERQQHLKRLELRRIQRKEEQERMQERAEWEVEQWLAKYSAAKPENDV